MHRRDREISERAEMEALLTEAPACRLGLCDGGQPYVVPVTFVYEEGAVYVHSSPEGEKIRILRKNPRVCVEVDSIGRVIPGDDPCRWSMSYRSVIGQGTAKWVEEPGEKARALAALVRKYSGQGDVEIPTGGLHGVAVIRIALGSMTGKLSTGS